MERMVSRHGCDINAVDRGGKTAMFCAAEDGDLEAVRILLRLDADVNKHEANQFTPLYVAAIQGNLACVDALLSLRSPGTGHVI